MELNLLELNRIRFQFGASWARFANPLAFGNFGSTLECEFNDLDRVRSHPRD